MKSLTVKDLLEAKGKRQLSYVQVAREEEAVATSQAGMDMIGTAFIPERAHFAMLDWSRQRQHGQVASASWAKRWVKLRWSGNR